MTAGVTTNLTQIYVPFSSEQNGKKEGRKEREPKEYMCKKSTNTTINLLHHSVCVFFSYQLSARH